MTKKTTILGTIRKQQREVPNTESLMKDKLSHDSEIFSSPSNCSLTVYKAKKKKIVCILSSTHKHVKVDESHKKKLPETVQYYNKSKVGVDVLNQMARYHTCKRRWPVAGDGLLQCFSISLIEQSVSSWQSCVKVCCSKHTFEKVTFVTCKNCKN